MLNDTYILLLIHTILTHLNLRKNNISNSKKWVESHFMPVGVKKLLYSV